MNKKRKQIGRIRYDENFHGGGEHFVFEWKWNDEPNTAWSMECAFALLELSDGKLNVGKGNGELINYQALTKVREWLKMGMDIYFK